MINYKVADLVITEDNKVKVFDVDGSIGGGLRLLRDAYGAKRAREDVSAFLQDLNALAKGKLILYRDIGSPGLVGKIGKAA